MGQGKEGLEGLVLPIAHTDGLGGFSRGSGNGRAGTLFSHLSKSSVTSSDFFVTDCFCSCVSLLVMYRFSWY